ncbi:MAG: bacteriohopanetetrol glucosamine biosynthesis glycosyltransferase HpnI [Elusimicrobia bacterium]|nr:bacteriohopanetetrol glucosamine biosynthesis glycosyltransferase HpnI [Elusimicrobiota bacterium]
MLEAFLADPPSLTELIKSVFSVAAGFAGVFSAGFCLSSAVCGSFVLRPKRRAEVPDADLPPVTMLKPLKGRDRGLYQNLASFCSQDYPRFQIVFALDDTNDPAAEVIEELKKDFPETDMEVVVSSTRIGCNPKINNLANAYHRVKHDTLVIADSDIRVRPDFLRVAVRPLRDPRVGIVTCFYRACGAKGVWGMMDELAINAHFLPQALTAAFMGVKFAMGAAIVLRRSAFDKTGGFKNLADHIADDFFLGRSIQAAGFRLAFAETVVDVIPDVHSYEEHIRHQIREHRVIRLCKPSEYGGILLLHGFSLLTLRMAFVGPDALGVGLLALLWAVKAASVAWIQERLLDGRVNLRSLWLLPLSEWTAFASWICGFGYNRVVWRGVFYAIHPNGKLTPLTPPLAARAGAGGLPSPCAGGRSVPAAGAGAPTG